MHKLRVGVTLILFTIIAGCTTDGDSMKSPTANTPKKPSIASGRNTSGSELLVSPQPGSLSAADIVAKLESRGLKAEATGEKIKELFGATSAEVLMVEGIPIQIYAFPDSPSANRALQAASNPVAHTITWSADPHFIELGNLLITVITNSNATAQKITGALQ